MTTGKKVLIGLSVMLIADVLGAVAVEVAKRETEKQLRKDLTKGDLVLAYLDYLSQVNRMASRNG